jgi:hypothetical protein
MRRRARRLDLTLRKGKPNYVGAEPGFMLVDPVANVAMLGGGSFGFEATLAEVEAFLAERRASSSVNDFRRIIDTGESIDPHYDAIVRKLRSHTKEEKQLTGRLEELRTETAWLRAVKKEIESRTDMETK